MPISPELRPLYPADWAAISRARKAAAGWACEFCGARHGEPHPLTLSRVVLTTAHLDHDPRNNAAENLRALCQRCHLAHDQDHHRRNAAATRRRRMGTAELALDPAPHRTAPHRTAPHRPEPGRAA